MRDLGGIDGVGHRFTGNRTGRSRNRGIGWVHLLVAIDDASRLMSRSGARFRGFAEQRACTICKPAAVSATPLSAI